MTVTAISMRRSLFGEGSLVETLLGRVLVSVLFTAVVGAVLTLLFSVNRVWPPFVLKYAILGAVGLGSGFAARRFLIGRNILLRFGSAIISLLVALTVMNVLTLGFIGLNFLRAYPNNPAWDGAWQLALTSALAFLALRVRPRFAREVMVEPRYTPAAEPTRTTVRRPASRNTRTVGRPRVAHRTRRSDARATRPTASARRNGLTARLSSLFTAPSSETARRKRVAGRPTKVQPRRRGIFRRRAVAFSGAEQHVCPYCLERVIRSDPRGVKICKVCKTWHHADCWDITGVCQVPHQYVN